MSVRFSRLSGPAQDADERSGRISRLGAAKTRDDVERGEETA